MRLFIAIEIPDEIKKEMLKVQEQLRKANIDASWPRAEGMHLTLKFLGEVPEKKIAEIVSGLQKAAEGIGKLRLEVKGVGTFPNPRNARVVWIGLFGDIGKLTKLQEAIENAMAGIGLARDQRKFTAHLTLGRIKYIRSRDLWLSLLSEIKDRSLTGFDATAISLMQSELKPSGAVYTEMGRVELQ
jgi:2'-5' RNA ligase